MPGSRRFSFTEKDRLLDIDEVASFLGLTREAIYQRRQRGDFAPAVKVGWSLRWRGEDLQAWLDANGQGQR